MTPAPLDNTPIVVVKHLAGHEQMDTTIRYYQGIKKRSLGEAVQNRRTVG